MSSSENAAGAGGFDTARTTGLVTSSGIDLVPVQDLAVRMSAQPDLEARIFTRREISYCRSRPRRSGEHFAARFAAKEAVLKALEADPGHRIAWTDIEVAKRVDGRPYIRLHGAAEQHARSRRVRAISVSLSHAGGLSIASALVTCGLDEAAPAGDTDAQPEVQR